MAAHAATTCGTPPKEESHEGAAGAYKGRGWGEGDRSTRRPLAKLYKSDTPKAINTGAEDTERGTQAMVQTRIGLERERRGATHTHVARTGAGSRQGRRRSTWKRRRSRRAKGGLTSMVIRRWCSGSAMGRTVMVWSLGPSLAIPLTLARGPQPNLVDGARRARWRCGRWLLSSNGPYEAARNRPSLVAPSRQGRVGRDASQRNRALQRRRAHESTPGQRQVRTADK